MARGYGESINRNYKRNEKKMTKKVKYLSSILAPVSIGELIDIKTSLPNINLENWARFEEKHTNTLRKMYQFWVCKTEN